MIERTRTIKEELMAYTWNPDTTLGRWLIMNELE
jgi:hypothetical protein